MTQTAVQRILQTSRHAIHLTDGLQEPRKPLHPYLLRRTYKRHCERMRRFIRETNATREHIEVIVEALRQLMAVDMFRSVLKAEGLVNIPAELAERISGSRGFSAQGRPGQAVMSDEPLVAGICPKAIELLEDFGVHPKIFGLLKKGTPNRQVEVAKLMVALDRVTFISARVIIALTPQLQLADPSIPRKRFFGIDTDTFDGMEVEFAALSREFLDANECLGIWSLELVAARGYLHRLMDNLKVVRYLAGNYPSHFETFHRLLEPDLERAAGV
ncbi:plasmid partitioning protein RepB C-terminal domain-containing protein [Mesorhizobium ciceri]|uniref:plasmid partitioning protein RepB C-terminal domain-containing protein n=1 Tax=Mesorhizobium TaxID=68287 RepID=UPI00067E8A04|nr:plasmid partitioning protein RepB C-terminal domain-containing protein [Mesorhizobium ciceri]